MPGEGLSPLAAERLRSGVVFRQQFSKRSEEFVVLQGEAFLQLKSQKQELLLQTGAPFSQRQERW